MRNALLFVISMAQTEERKIRTCPDLSILAICAKVLKEALSYLPKIHGTSEGHVNGRPFGVVMFPSPL